MVLLTMTTAVVNAVGLYTKSEEYQAREDEPSLQSPAVGNPITHSQLIEVSKFLRSNPGMIPDALHPLPIYLSDLLKGCGLYAPPPTPKPEQTNEYKALMARLRAEEESRKYHQMLEPETKAETFQQRFPTASYGHLFPPQPTATSADEDEVTYADINRQLTMVANVLISIIACSVSVWKVAWHWDVPARLALSMVSSIVVAVAEVAIYAGYIGRLNEARDKEREKVEKKEIAESWVIEAKPKDKSTKAIESARLAQETTSADLRHRIGKKTS